jgi:hypothetical protein
MGLGESSNVSVIVIASVTVLLGFSISGLIPDAEAAWKAMSSTTPDYDYMVQYFSYGDPGRYVYSSVKCMNEDKPVGGVVQSNSMNGPSAVYYYDIYDGISADGFQIFKTGVQGYVYNDSTFRTWMRTMAYCVYR